MSSAVPAEAILGQVTKRSTKKNLPTMIMRFTASHPLLPFNHYYNCCYANLLPLGQRQRMLEFERQQQINKANQ
jgi:hypothetical protein